MTQQEALAIMDTAPLVLLTGAAGSGKTYTLRQYIKHQRAVGNNVAVTATTGLAATHLNGITIHSWSGIGIHDFLPANHYQKMAKQRRDIIKKTDILIIDEISMLHDFRLDLIDDTCRIVRESNEPFGGLKVVLCGDFYQLPPVSRSGARAGLFITSSNAWNTYGFTTCYLHEQHRQKEDQSYTDILNGIRRGFLTGRQLHNLRSRQTAPSSPKFATRLLTVNVDVDSINQKHLDEIVAAGFVYTMESTGRAKYVQQLKQSCLAPENLELKIGTRVMCIKNSPDKRYINGSLGIVEDFESNTNYPIIMLNNGRQITVKPDTWELVDGEKVRASVSQLPLRLAWAITVHKSQGMTLDAARIDLSKAFVEGMGYVALSRVKSLDFLTLDGLNGMALRVSPLAKEIDADLQMRSQQAITQYSDAIKNWQASSKSRQRVEVDASKNKSTWQEKLVKMRQEYPNAYKPWREEDDKQLVTEFSNGRTVKELSSIMGRHNGSIKARLEKHFGEDCFDDQP